ncbi:MAG: S24/S26 family peptidase [Candidatus Omnitrophota bacterium]
MEEAKFISSNEFRIELIQAVFAKNAGFRFIAKGFSMFPFIQDNDIITLSPLRHSSLGLGKVVACVCPTHKKLLLHRIVARKKSYYLIKGDNITKPDFLIDKRHILGCVTLIKRNNKTILLGLGPERVFIAFLSKIGVLSLLHSLSQLIPYSLRRFIKCRFLS